MLNIVKFANSETKNRKKISITAHLDIVNKNM